MTPSLLFLSGTTLGLFASAYLFLSPSWPGRAIGAGLALLAVADLVFSVVSVIGLLSL